MDTSINFLSAKLKSKDDITYGIRCNIFNALLVPVTRNVPIINIKIEINQKDKNYRDGNYQGEDRRGENE